MGCYTCSTIEDQDYKRLIATIRNGYIDREGVKHRPNVQIATILVLEANLGCRIGDIMSLETDSIVWDGGVWKLDIIEEKTGKHRSFIVPQKVKDFIDNYAISREIVHGKLFTISAQAVWKCLRQVTRYLELEKISTHSMRKKCAIELYTKSGYDIELVSSFLNHSSIAVTRTYLKRSSKQMEEAISQIVDLA